MNDTIDTTIPQEEQEIWKPIPSFPGYEISDHGKVRSYLTTGNRPNSPHPVRFIKQSRNNGYHYVGLVRNGKQYTRFVHSLLLTAFVGLRPVGQVACHNDGVRDNNCLSNLRWDTPRNNHHDCIAHGTRRSGEKHHKAILSAEEVVVIRNLYAGGCLARIIASQFSLKINHVIDIVSGRIWKQTGGPILKNQNYRWTTATSNIQR